MELEAVAVYLEADLVEDARMQIGARSPIAGGGRAVALMSPSNSVAAVVADIAQLVLGGNSVRARLPGRAAQARTLVQQITDEVIPGRVVMEDASGPDFLAEVMESDQVPMVVVYGGEQLGDSLLRKVQTIPPKKVLFEGPGKDPMVVLPGVDVDQVVATIVTAKMRLGGQECVAPETLLVHESLHDELVTRLTSAFASVRVGDPDDPRTQVGPMSSNKVPAIVAGQLEDALKRGAKVTVGGRIDGQWIEPTLVVGVTSDMLIFQDETFAPVLAVVPFDDEEHAANLACSTRFGLSCTVTGEGAEILADRLRSSAYLRREDDGLEYGRFGMSTIDHPAGESWDGGYGGAFGGYGKSGWVWDHGELRQGPKSIAREATT